MPMDTLLWILGAAGVSFVGWGIKMTFMWKGMDLRQKEIKATVDRCIHRLENPEKFGLGSHALKDVLERLTAVVEKNTLQADMHMEILKAWHRPKD